MIRTYEVIKYYKLRLLGQPSSKENFGLFYLADLKHFLFITGWQDFWTLSFIANERLETIILYYEKLDLFKELSLSIIIFDYLEVSGDLN